MISDVLYVVLQTSYYFFGHAVALFSRNRLPLSRYVVAHIWYHASLCVAFVKMLLTLILRRSRTGTVWFYTSTSNKRAAHQNCTQSH